MRAQQRLQEKAELPMTVEHDAENTLIMETSKGKVVIGLRPDLAPKHVERIKKLAREGFYDCIAFHRVIDGFMAQTDRKSTRLNSSHLGISYAVFWLKKKTKKQ